MISFVNNDMLVIFNCFESIIIDMEVGGGIWFEFVISLDDGSEMWDVVLALDLIATDIASLGELGTEGGSMMGALISSNGISTGENVFDISIVNLGKIICIEG